VRLATLVALPTVITGPGKYRTRSGEVVTIVEPWRGWWRGAYPSGTPEAWDPSGRLLPFSETGNDVVARAEGEPPPADRPLT
jgi:hypothetical protein